MHLAMCSLADSPRYQTSGYGNLILSTASAAVSGVNVRIILQIPLIHTSCYVEWTAGVNRSLQLTCMRDRFWVWKSE